MLLKLHFSPVWRAFSFTDKTLIWSSIYLVTHRIPYWSRVTFEVSTQQTAIYFFPFFALEAIQNKAGRETLAHLTKADLMSDQWFIIWQNEAFQLMCCTWRLTDCRVMTHSVQQRVVKIYSERSTPSHSVQYCVNPLHPKMYSLLKSIFQLRKSISNDCFHHMKSNKSYFDRMWTDHFQC